MVKNKADAAYARSDLFEKRRTLMESWSTTSPDGTAIARTGFALAHSAEQVVIAGWGG